MLLGLSVFSMLFAIMRLIFSQHSLGFQIDVPATLSGQVIILAYLLKVLLKNITCNGLLILVLDEQGERLKYCSTRVAEKGG